MSLLERYMTLTVTHVYFTYAWNWNKLKSFFFFSQGQKGDIGLPGPAGPKVSDVSKYTPYTCPVM